MNKYYFIIISVVLLVLPLSCTTDTPRDDLTSKTKVVLRAVGNELLLSQGDSTSLVMPVVQITDNSYLLSFEHPLSFDPIDLYNAMEDHADRANLPSEYGLEVLRCSDGEVGYSYLLFEQEINNIIPCSGRLLPEDCYTIQFNFMNTAKVVESKRSPLFYLLVVLVLLFLALVFYSKYYAHKKEIKESNATVIGSFYFYPEQNKLVKSATEIPLSKKECELLTILAKSPNKIVKREALEKEVWEDQGVVVGRSLDTYISKLRKKLQSDDTLRIVNVHGVGYKLEILD